MRLLLAGGGTAGHINPALAIATFVKSKEADAQILYVGAKGKMEEKLVPKAGFDFKAIEIAGFKRSLAPCAIKHNINTLKLIISSEKTSRKIISEFKPDICIGTGGYVSGPVIRTAQKMGIPTLIHEQNAFPGVTTKMLSKKANCVMLAVEDAKKHLDASCNISFTGNPIRKSINTIDKESAKKELNLEDKPLILSFGGSLGARKINEAVAELLEWSCKEKKYQHIHAYGQYGKWMPELLKGKGVDISHKDIDIREYIDNMPNCLAAADLVICRAGAITLSEIQAAGKAAILIPSPNVAENHQYHNAMALVDKNAAFILEEKDLSGKTLINLVKDVMQNQDKLKICGENAKQTAKLNADEIIYQIIKQQLCDVSKH